MGTGERVRYETVFADSARWDGLVFRADDIVISTPAKCGTSWLQTIRALEIFQCTTFDRPLDRISPWLDVPTGKRCRHPAFAGRRTRQLCDHAIMCYK